MIIDCHAHIMSSPSLLECEDTLLASMDKYGVDFALVSNCDAAEFPTGASAEVSGKDALTCLKETMTFVKQYPTRLGAAVWIRPVFEKGPSRELREYVSNNRDHIFALKFHPYAERTRVDSPLLEPYLDWAEKERLPVLVHTAEDEYSDVDFLVNVANLRPKIRFIAAHLQLLSDHSKGVEALRKAPNIYADTAWVPMKISAKVLRSIGPIRMMFGTDNPIDGLDTLSNPMYADYFKNKSRLSACLWKRLMSRNAIDLFSLPFPKDFSEVQ